MTYEIMWNAVCLLSFVLSALAFYGVHIFRNGNGKPPRRKGKR